VVDRKTESIVRLRPGGVCEYCRLPEAASHLPFPMDHIIARQHGGRSDDLNLALVCPECNLHKGPNIAGLDPETGELTRLFHPRQDRWTSHFRWVGALLVGQTAVGRTTIYVIDANSPNRLSLRHALMLAGTFPRDPATTA
jgi:hypothetical protein